MDDEHGYLDLSATGPILRAIYCGSRHSSGIGDAPHLCGRHPLNLTRNLIVFGRSEDRQSTKALLNLAEECLRLIPLRAESALGGVAFCFHRLHESDVCVPEIPGSLIALASALISTLLEEPLGHPPRLLRGRDATVRLRIDRRVSECERCCGE